jgi:hypothetical protein
VLPSRRRLFTSPRQLPPSSIDRQTLSGSGRSSGRQRVSSKRTPCSAWAVNPVISTWAALTVTTRRSASAMITPSAMLPSALAAMRRSCSIATRSDTSRMIA